jgi:protoporphyrinogen oxidase
VTGARNLGVAVLGGGPAGLTAAYVLATRGERGVVLEAGDQVGGLARTVEFKGYRFDIGGHRFFTKLTPIRRMWEEMLGEDFLTRPRLSRIYYSGQYLAYPLQTRDVVARLGVVESARCAGSYLRSKLGRKTTPATFEEWVVHRFGRRLYDAFFRSYTEKVWGIPGREIQAEWAAQRIKNFSLAMAIMSMLGLRRGPPATTLIDEFQYPRLGPGQMWEAFRDWVEERDIPVLFHHRCVGIRHEAGKVERVIVRINGSEREYPVDAVLSSIPLPELVHCLDPPAPAEVLAAAERLRYRNFCLVALMTRETEPFPDNWIYLHDPRTQAGRVQNFGAWSKDMVREGTTCLGVEYFCFEDDEIWKMSDEQAVRMAVEDLETIGLLDSGQVTNGVKVRVPRAYPMYDAGYREAVAEIRGYLEHFENLKTFGRNGLHRYNNQDHSMWTAILATLNHTDRAAHDVWSVNTKAEYLEAGPLAESLEDLDLVA